jgi:hypothetical protein
VNLAFSAPHAAAVTAALPFTIGRVRLCTPNSLDDAAYRRKRDELRKLRDDGVFTNAEFDAADRELLACKKH